MAFWIALAIFIAFLGCELHRRWQHHKSHHIDHFHKTEMYRRDFLR